MALGESAGSPQYTWANRSVTKYDTSFPKKTTWGFHADQPEPPVPLDDEEDDELGFSANMIEEQGADRAGPLVIRPTG